MERNNKIIEAILFIRGAEGLSSRQLGTILQLSIPAARKIIKTYMTDFNQRGGGLQILELNDIYKLFTTKEMKSIISQFVSTEKQYKLSQAAIETAGIIAYKQPITRSGVSNIRGVSSDGVINTLLVKNLIHEVGIAKTPGSPILYGISDNFYDYFKIQSLKELPELNEFIPEEELDDDFDLYASQREN